MITLPPVIKKAETAVHRDAGFLSQLLGQEDHLSSQSLGHMAGSFLKMKEAEKIHVNYNLEHSRSSTASGQKELDAQPQHNLILK